MKVIHRSLALLLFLSPGIFAQSQPAAEPKVRFRLAPSPTVVFSLPGFPAGTDLDLHVAVLDRDDSVMAEGTEHRRTTPATRSVAVDLKALKQKDDWRPSDYAWLRIRYEMTAKSESGQSEVRNTVSLGRAMADLFQLDLTYPGGAAPGSRFRFRVKAENPLSKLPVAGVRLTAKTTLDRQGSEGLELTRSAVTNARGVAEFSFDIPRQINAAQNELELEVSGERGGYQQQESFRTHLVDRSLVLLTTDKLLYQPGQTMHIRAVTMDRQRHPVANDEMEITVKDPAYQVVFQGNASSSAHGVGFVDWKIPGEQKLGSYEVMVQSSQHASEDRRAARVRISRYDLPEFRVTAKPDRPYYLQGQKAVLTAKAEYLFGKPVKHAKVHIAQEEAREWDYKAQRYNVREGKVYEGVVDEKGEFKATVDLDAPGDRYFDRWRMYNDVRFRATVTDVTTGRTEETPFMVRITKDELHVYYTLDAAAYPSPKKEISGFLTSYLPDGQATPAAIEIFFVPDKNEKNEVSREVHIGSVVTNRLGIGRFEELRLPDWDAQNENPSLVFKAHTKDGKSGRSDLEIYDRGERPSIGVTPVKVLLGPAQPAVFAIVCDGTDKELVTDLYSADDVLLGRQITRMADHKGEARFDYRPEFQGLVFAVTHTETAKAEEYSRWRSLSQGSAAVIYPTVDRSVKLNARLSAATFRPGDTASLDFQVLNAEGRPAEAALGAVVFDEAVEQRAHDDFERGEEFGFTSDDRYTSRVAGLSLKDLLHRNTREEPSAELESVARLLTRYETKNIGGSGGEAFDRSPADMYWKPAMLRMDPARKALIGIYDRTDQYPRNQQELEQLLASRNVRFEDVRDPWDRPVIAKFALDRASDVLELWSDGEDRKRGNEDDFPVLQLKFKYFTPTGRLIQQIQNEHFETNEEYIRDVDALAAEMKERGVDVEQLRDRWGHPYRFAFYTAQAYDYLTVTSAGPDGVFKGEEREGRSPSWDDFVVWQGAFSFFVKEKKLIDSALARSVGEGKHFPQTEKEFMDVLLAFHVPFSSWRDRWHQPYYLRARRVQYSRLGEKIPAETTVLEIMSVGPNGTKNDWDDFSVAIFFEHAGKGSTASVGATRPVPDARSGVLSGTVADPRGAVIPGAQVTATDPATGTQYSATTNSSGAYSIGSLPTGGYQVRVEATGFMRATAIVEVDAGQERTIDFELAVGKVEEVVEVSEASPLVETESSLVSSKPQLPSTAGKQTPPRAPIYTPRLRGNFPETLYWQPEALTDEKGRVHVEFPIADNITNWKLSAMAHTLDGELAFAKKEFNVTLPFFLTSDPPKILTVGDTIHLPVVLRNYTDHAQAVSVHLEPEPWFGAGLNATKALRIKVEAGEAASAVFGFTASASVADGRHQVTASDAQSRVGDAVERSVTVHPDGESRELTAGGLIVSNGLLRMDLPAEIFPDSLHAELKVYPNLLANIFESVEGALQRPYGCGEQTISSTYPSVLAIRLFESGPKLAAANPLAEARARRYLDQGYKRLLGFRKADGGFGYWVESPSDLALTAEALQFLLDADELIDVDESVIDGVRKYLLQRQRPDGGWGFSDPYNESLGGSRSDFTRSMYVVEALGRLKKPPAEELNKAMAYLQTVDAKKLGAFDVAHLALAAKAAGQSSFSLDTARLLKQLVLKDEHDTYWQVDHPTLFHGWGRAGDVETTALAVQLLGDLKDDSEAYDLARGGFSYLLKTKDRYGVWYSTSTTMNVLNAVMRMKDRIQSVEGPAKLTVRIGGKEVSAIDLDPEDPSLMPKTLDLSAWLKGGQNTIELSTNQAAPLQVQSVATFYTSWQSSRSASPILRFKAEYDKREAKAGDQITACATAERVQPKDKQWSWGMLIGEVGLPPGAEVDRESLDRAKRDSGWQFQSYEIRPDKVVLYLWPWDKPISSCFHFRMRYAIDARTAPSVLYDYYNPDARIVVPPVRFTVN